MGKWTKPPGRKLSSKRYDDELARVHWTEFERIMRRWYVLQGYAVEDRGTQSGRRLTDGGVDLVLKGRGEKILVQCKHERVLQVPFNAAMQLRGLIHAEEADRAILVTTGEFTPEALRKASKAGLLELIDGEALRRMLGPDIARLRDGAWIEPMAATPNAPAEAAGLAVISQPGITPAAPAVVPRVSPRAVSPKRTALTLVAFVIVLVATATVGVRGWGARTPPMPPAIAPPTAQPPATAPVPRAADKRSTEPTASRHVGAAKKPHPTARTPAPAPAPASAPTPPEVIYKSADMSDAEFDAWKLRKARREAEQRDVHDPVPPPAPTADPEPSGPPTPARTMQVILRTNRS